MRDLLDAILIFSNCSIMTGCHQLDSLLARYHLQESLKKKLYTPFPGQTGFLSDYFSQTIGQIELKFHVKTPYDKLAKIYVKYFGHVTEMSATPIYGKNHLKSSYPEPEGR